MEKGESSLRKDIVQRVVKLMVVDGDESILDKNMAAESDVTVVVGKTDVRVLKSKKSADDRMSFEQVMRGLVKGKI